VVARRKEDKVDNGYEFHLPRKFFLATLFAGLTSVAFFSLDNILVAHLLSPTQVGQYSFLGLFGKMIFFVGNLAASFLAPLVARSEGAGKNGNKIFTLTFISVACMTAIGYAVFGLGVYVFGPIYFAAKIAPVHHVLLLYGLGISAFTLAQVFVSYHLTKHHYVFSVVGVALSILEIVCLFTFHQSLTEIVYVMTAIGALHFVVFSTLHLSYERLLAPMQNFRDFIGLLTSSLNTQKARDPKKLRVLFFNWRDTKHAWSGGAEVYIHELAKELVSLGYSVTEFCGNDGRSKHEEEVDGVQVLRHGGFYTVYFWSAAYYLWKLRKQVDVIIDSENGIPFFTPLFVRKPIFLLIHHVHQEYFRTYLKFPINHIVGSLESILMPLIYRRVNVITISKSSKSEILRLGLGTPNTISVINPGIHLSQYKPRQKTKYPSLCYVGRLKAYKNIDIAIQAFAELHEEFPTARFIIAGVGEHDLALRKMISKQKMEKFITLAGKVSEQEKVSILGQSWVAVQPSMIEGWGITVIEANACGTPVIASDINGLKDSTQHGVTGVLVPVRDVKAMREAMRSLFSSSRMRTKYAQDALAWSSNFQWKHSGAQLDVLLQKQFTSERKSYAPLKSFT
jgi:glycosyltransferase involved in cell wall biosynthesis